MLLTKGTSNRSMNRLLIIGLAGMTNSGRAGMTNNKVVGTYENSDRSCMRPNTTGRAMYVCHIVWRITRENVECSQLGQPSGDETETHCLRAWPQMPQEVLGYVVPTYGFRSAWSDCHKSLISGK